MALSLVGAALFTGCQKAGGGGGGESSEGTSPSTESPGTTPPSTPPPSTTPPSTTPPSTTPPAPNPVVGISLVAGQPSLVADGASSTTISAQMVTANGTPAPNGTVVTFRTDIGRFTTAGAKSISATTSQGTGTVIVPFLSEEDVTGTATIVASATGLSQSIQLTFLATTPVPPPPVTIGGMTLTSGVDSLVADGTSSTTITAALTTTTGLPAPAGITVNFVTDLGRFTTAGAKEASATTLDSSGIIVVPFISEAGVVGTATIVASVGLIIQSVKIQLTPSTQPPPPADTIVGITLETGADSLVANGTSSTTIIAILNTITGTPAPDGVTVNFITDKGRFSTNGAKTASATTSNGTGGVVVPFISEEGIVGTATIVASVGGVAQSTQIALTGAGDPDSIILTADSTTLALFGTTGVTAEVLDDEGNPVTDGTAVLFATSLQGTGVTPSSTTIDGLASAVFSAGTQSGVATVTASSGAASATVSITIQAGPAGSLEFVSAEPTVIGVRGSALPQKSTITFRVRDVNGNPVGDGTLVTFTLISGVGGGETLEPTQAGTTAGVASTVLTSGTVSGPVRVQASVIVGTVTLTSTSTNVSIAGGAPSGAHLGVAPAFRNIAGLVTQGIICPVAAIVGDRFGNPVPLNTAVSYLTNGGVVGAQGLTDDLGNAFSEIKTGPPTPRALPSPDIAISDPRTGMVTLIAVTQGEETFIDSNGNGLFDGPQEFDPSDPDLDTPEPFIDHINLCNGLPFPAPCPILPPSPPPTLSGDGQFDPTNRFELFLDANSNGIWDEPNDVWDANKPIFATTTVLFTGPTQLTVGVFQTDGSCSGTPSFDVPDGGSSATFCFFAQDPAGRPLVGGTQISVTTSSGAISGTSNLILPDTQRGGAGITFFTFAVVDDDAGDDDPPADALVTINVVSPSTTECPGGNGNASASFTGRVD